MFITSVCNVYKIRNLDQGIVLIWIYSTKEPNDIEYFEKADVQFSSKKLDKNWIHCAMLNAPFAMILYRSSVPAAQLNDEDFMTAF